MAATLAGLLFVALSFNLELLARAEHEPTHRIATEAFTMFLYVLLVALLVTAMGVLRQWPWVLHWAGIVLIVLLFAAVRRAWYLLVTVRRLELRAAAR